MSRWKTISLVLIVGIGIGLLVPPATAWWYDRDRVSTALTSIVAGTIAAAEPAEPAETAVTNQTSPKEVYHFGLEQGVLSVIEGKPGTSGRVILRGLSVKSWPKEILEITPKVEFYSLDEVQSFIDTVNEPLWRE